MKFAQYLRDTQTPEWKRAYIDYRGLKKRITAIRQAQLESVQLGGPGPSIPRNSLNEGRPSDTRTEDIDLEAPSRASSSSIPPIDVVPRTHERASPQLTRRRNSTWSRRATMAQSAIPSIKWSKTQTPSNRLGGPQSRPINPMATLPLRELLTYLTPQEASFFHYLDAQLDKVESFYSSREKELLLRTQLLQKQLHELHDHRKFVHEANENHPNWSSSVAAALKLKLRPHPVIEMSATDSQTDASDPITSPKGKGTLGWSSMLSPVPSISHAGPSDEAEKAETSSFQDAGRSGQPRFSDLDYYLHARKKLKKAVLEHYRGLELLLNYRILNLTGFRKALKKFEKVTKIRAQDQYMAEKVDLSALGSDSALQQMMKEMQELYAQTFSRGNSKKAMDRLRGGFRSKTHHFSTLRSGILIGVAIPALASGLYYSFLEETREQIPDWDALLYFYGIFLIPVVFSMLIGLNLLVWARSRVNYTFIFELDVRSRMDYREYYEIPSFLLASLCYAFWLSFARVGSPHVSPTIWPLVWLALTAAILFDPLPLLFRSSRSWFLRIVGRLFMSGTRRVEFADFWMGDQFCSLVFTLSNLYMFVCVYANGYQEDWNACASRSSAWPAAFVLASLPSLGGKYGSGIVNYLFYYLWRHQETHYNGWFALWLIFTTVYSTYATCWDLLMDWSLLRAHAKHFLLRDELGYSNHIYLYYFAIVTNCLIRFAWVIYIPEHGPNTLIRTFIVGFLEMLRRVQWNFYRLENEHLGNMDQYRVTREVPLPYAFDTNHRGDYDGDDSEQLSEPQTPTSGKD
ncbi:hypothetical protein D9756_006619 [Leucocoprinus leucothites]|uniref:Uncharacterized protein n=1 Tax=Leucocoprinus leucothites TaxID=201217 RepID=A0A8H5G242_9AGAR|nr:hypothetical protein D9756_006619 [Leucoagaricus leucothites]